MTLILGAKDPANDRVIICADSGAWRGDQYMRLTRQKLWRARDWVFGFAGNSMCQEFARHATISTPQTQDKPVPLQLQTAITDAIGEAQQRAKKVWESVDDFHFCMVAATGADLWLIGHDTLGCLADRFTAIGAPQDFATGAAAWAFAGDGAWQVLETCGGVMRVTQSVSEGLKPPFCWMATDGAEGEF